MAGSQISTAVTIISSLLGFQAISLTNFSTTAVPQIAAGSKIEIAGAFFTFAANETPNASSWTAVSAGNNAYITVIPAGSAGNQTITTEYNVTHPVWSTSKQGFYASAASLTRYIAHGFKMSAASFIQKQIMPRHPTVLYGENRPVFDWRAPLGEWNMDTTASKTVDFYFDSARDLLSADAWIRSDSGDLRNIIGYSYSSAYSLCGTITYSAAPENFTISRVAGGSFDSASFNGTASTIINRGWLSIVYTTGTSEIT